MPVRYNMLADGTPLQQATTRKSSQYNVEDMSIPMLGVILNVRPSDDVRNRSAAEFEDYRGYVPECTVLIVHDNMSLEHVLITPDAPAGLDDFYERLPRGSSAFVDGVEFSSSLGGLDPNKLDGDWCIVGFFKGLIDSPYIVRWWPNPNNRFDPATSGKAFPNKITGEGTALEQSGRYFTRVNGVECVITTEGNVNLSTRFSNSKVDFQKTSALSKVGDAVAGTGDAFQLPNTEGRPSREEREDGGSIRLQVKPSQTFEIDFTPQIDGMGWDDLPDEQLPQTNPHLLPSLPPNRIIPTYSYMRFDKDQVSIDTPVEFKVNAASITIAASTVSLGSATANQPFVLGTELVNALANYANALGAGTPTDPVLIGTAQTAAVALASALADVLSTTIVGE